MEKQTWWTRPRTWLALLVLIASGLAGVLWFQSRTKQLYEKADILGRRKEFAPALTAIGRALELRPQRDSLLYQRARLAVTQVPRDWQAAYSDLKLALQFAPADDDARSLVPYVANGLMSQGWEAHNAGKETEAIRLLDQASELRPSSDLERRRVAVLTAGFKGTDAEVTALEAAAKADPHDFYAYERLDYALSKRREWPRIAAMWNVYIAENPSDGRAFLELGGTLHNQGDKPAALGAASRACELGVSKACAILKLP